MSPPSPHGQIPVFPLSTESTVTEICGAETPCRRTLRRYAPAPRKTGNTLNADSHRVRREDAKK